MRLVCVAVFLLLSLGCDSVKQYWGYLVVKQERKWVPPDKQLGCPYSQCEVHVLTLKYRGNVIRAHCQAWDQGNKCNSITVGETYQFKREKDMGYLSLEKPDVILGIEEEHLE